MCFQKLLSTFVAIFAAQRKTVSHFERFRTGRVSGPRNSTRGLILARLLPAFAGLFRGRRLRDAHRIGRRKRIPQPLVEFFLRPAILPRGHVRIFRVPVVRRRIKFAVHATSPFASEIARDGNARWRRMFRSETGIGSARRASQIQKIRATQRAARIIAFQSISVSEQERPMRSAAELLQSSARDGVRREAPPESAPWSWLRDPATYPC